MKAELDGRPGSSKGSVTAEEFWDLCKDRWCELVDGEVVELTPASGEHGSIVVRMVVKLYPHSAGADLGGLNASDVGYRIRRKPDTVRAPDIAFVRKARVPPGGKPPETFGASAVLESVLFPGLLLRIGEVFDPR